MVRIRSPVPAKTVQVEKLGRFVFVYFKQRTPIFCLIINSYTCSLPPKWHKTKKILHILNQEFSIPIPLKCQHFVYTSHRFLLLFIPGMDVAVDGGLDIRVSYNRLNGLHRRSRIVQQGCVRVAEDVGRSPMEVDCASYRRVDGESCLESGQSSSGQVSLVRIRSPVPAQLKFQVCSGDGPCHFPRYGL